MNVTALLPIVPRVQMVGKVMVVLPNTRRGSISMFPEKWSGNDEMAATFRVVETRLQLLFRRSREKIIGRPMRRASS